MLAGIDRILAEARSDRALLNHGQRRRQCAGAQKDGQIVGLLDIEIAGNLPGTAEDRFADDRRRDHLVIEHDGEGFADILLGRLRELARAARIEAKADDRLAGALVEAGLGVDEIGAGHENAFFDEIFLSAFAVEDFRVLRHVGGRCLLRRFRRVDHAEVELRGLAENLLQPRRILQARHLHENAAGALALDGRLDQAKLVDAALDDLDRLIDGLADAFDDRRVRRGQRDQAASLGDVDAALARGTEYTGQRLRQLAQLADGVIHVTVARDAYLHAVAADGTPGEGDTRLAQNAQHIVGDSLEPLLAHGIGVDLEQQARAALQIEAKHDVPLRPGRPRAHRALGEKVRQGKQAHDERREQNPRRFPPREKQH